jgi:hypothetical protein
MSGKALVYLRAFVVEIWMVPLARTPNGTTRLDQSRPNLTGKAKAKIDKSFLLLFLETEDLAFLL